MISRKLPALVLVWLAANSVWAEATVDFNRDIRPLLSDRCFACHGPDRESRKAGLRLDVRSEAMSSGVVDLESPADSELIYRIESDDPELVMPPPGHGKPLDEAERQRLRRWIETGAPYQQHWSLAPLRRPLVPTLSDEVGLSNPIDSFVRRRLDAAGLNANQPADPRTLVRRLAFDLTGLPPDPSEVEAFVLQPSESAYQQLADVYLHSEHYGERLAMYWLDLVRYADTLGYHGDQVRSVSPYRDYVINAFNRNKPFDVFTVEQLAGDLLPDATLEQRVASTYNRLNRASAEGGVQPKEYLAKYAADRVRTTGAVWLGSTFGCAECHDHKFDPFTTEDFYSFAAFFADIKEQGIVRGANYLERLPVPTEEQSRRRVELERQLSAAELTYQQRTPELINEFRAWLEAVQRQAGRWTSLNIQKASSKRGAKLTVQSDGSVLAGGKNPQRDRYELKGTVNVPAIAALRLTVLPHRSLPEGGPGRASNGNLVVNQVELVIDGVPVQWTRATATHSQDKHSPDSVIDGHKTGWAILPRSGQAEQLVLIAKETRVLEAGPHELTVKIHQNHGNGHNLGRFQIDVSASSEGITTPLAATRELESIAAKAADQHTAAEREKLWEAFRAHTPLLDSARQRIAELSSELERLETNVTTTLATAATEPRTMRVLPRGDWMDDSGKIVTPSVPEFLPQPQEADGERLDRLDLARWMTSRDNPLVARTFVNRLWMLFFGEGLSRSVDDLGSQGQPPTHPDLLDWLAVEFVDSGWDVRHMVRLIVTSSTYRQSSFMPPELRRQDPFNRLLARQGRWRLEAEMIRDNALAVSELLVKRVGGTSVMPYQPKGYWAQLNFPTRTYQHDRGSGQYRRGLYTHWQRTFLHPSLLAFDAPSREECTAKRDRSNTPLQSLVLLNDPTYVEAARVLAARTLQHGGDTFASRLAWAYRQVLARMPRDSETLILMRLYKNNLANYRRSPALASELLNVGMAEVESQADAAETAAWTAVTRSLLNLHETISRY